jgi:hypothetical protein
MTPLIMAISRESLDLLSDLLDPVRLLEPLPDRTESPAADPNASDDRVESALSFCIRTYDQPKLQHAVTILKMLYEKGADVNAMSRELHFSIVRLSRLTP